MSDEITLAILAELDAGKSFQCDSETVMIWRDFNLDEVRMRRPESGAPVVRVKEDRLCDAMNAQPTGPTRELVISSLCAAFREGEARARRRGGQ